MAASRFCDNRNVGLDEGHIGLYAATPRGYAGAEQPSTLRYFRGEVKGANKDQKAMSKVAPKTLPKGSVITVPTIKGRIG